MQRPDILTLTLRKAKDIIKYMTTNRYLPSAQSRVQTVLCDFWVHASEPVCSEKASAPLTKMYLTADATGAGQCYCFVWSGLAAVMVLIKPGSIGGLGNSFIHGKDAGMCVLTGSEHLRLTLYDLK